MSAWVDNNPWDLSPGQSRCLNEFCNHGSVAKTAKALGLADKSVESYLSECRKKMNVANSYLAVAHWITYKITMGWRPSAVVAKSDARRVRMELVLECVKEQPGLTRAEIAERLQMRPTYVSNTLFELSDRRLIKCQGFGRYSKWFESSVPVEENAPVKKKIVNSVFALA